MPFLAAGCFFRFQDLGPFLGLKPVDSFESFYIYQWLWQVFYFIWVWSLIKSVVLRHFHQDWGGLFQTSQGKLQLMEYKYNLFLPTHWLFHCGTASHRTLCDFHYWYTWNLTDSTEDMSILIDTFQLWDSSCSPSIWTIFFGWSQSNLLMTSWKSCFTSMFTTHGRGALGQCLRRAPCIVQWRDVKTCPNRTSGTVGAIHIVSAHRWGRGIRHFAYTMRTRGSGVKTSAYVRRAKFLKFVVFFYYRGLF